MADEKNILYVQTSNAPERQYSPSCSPRAPRRWASTPPSTTWAWA